MNKFKKSIIFGILLLIIGVSGSMISILNMRYDSVWFIAFLTSVIVATDGIIVIDNYKMKDR